MARSIRAALFALVLCGGSAGCASKQSWERCGDPFCRQCGADRFYPCPDCQASGRVFCIDCGGFDSNSCLSCKGTSLMRCGECGGVGRLKCGRWVDPQRVD